MTEEFLLIGSKPYINMDVNKLIDYFPRNGRCNMAVPFGNNGSKKDELFVCTHVSEVITKYYEPEQTEEIRKDAWSLLTNEDTIYKYPLEYKNEFLKVFHETFKFKDYKITKFTEPDKEKKSINKFFKEIGCPYMFQKQPRTGISAIVKKLKEQIKPFVFGFTIDEEETRKSYYVQDHVFKKEDNQQSCHDKKQEIYALRWLHANNFVDATLCMVQDKSELELKTNDLTPRQESLDILGRIK